MTSVQLSKLTGVTVANLSVPKNDRARAIRFTTLTAICTALVCEPGDVLGPTDQTGESTKTRSRDLASFGRPTQACRGSRTPGL